MQIFDAHTHIYETGTVPEELMQRLQNANMAGATIISQPPTQHPHVVEGGGYGYSERMEELMRVTGGYKEQLFPILWIHPDEDGILSKIDDAISKGVRGFKMICSNYFVYEDKCMKVLEHIAKTKKPVLFHTGILWNGEVSSAYNKPINWECCLELDGLKFALAHCSWPWYDECIALYGKFMHAYTLRPNLSAEMFFDLTPGTPEIYREDLLTKLLTIGYDVKHNILFGTDCRAKAYESNWALKWQEIDNAIYDKLSVSEEDRNLIYGQNLKRFLGISSDHITRKVQMPDGSMTEV